MICLCNYRELIKTDFSYTFIAKFYLLFSFFVLFIFFFLFYYYYFIIYLLIPKLVMKHLLIYMSWLSNMHVSNLVVRIVFTGGCILYITYLKVWLNNKSTKGQMHRCSFPGNNSNYYLLKLSGFTDEIFTLIYIAFSTSLFVTISTFLFFFTLLLCCTCLDFTCWLLSEIYLIFVINTLALVS